MRFALGLTARLLVVVLLATMGSGCTTRMQVHLDRDTDFSQYRTWGWQTRRSYPRRAAPSTLDVQVARQIQSALREGRQGASVL